MNEESQERRPQQQMNNLPLQGHWGKRDAAGPTHRF